jgi:enoyl-CoA hydratase/3-hydroxyacyl-CoA dehydrogenase
MYKKAYPERVYLSALSDLLLKDNRLGEKTQKGYYNYKGSRKEQPAPELEVYLAESRRIAGFIPDGKVNK